MKITDIIESFDSYVDRRVVRSNPSGTVMKADIGGRTIVYSSSMSYDESYSVLSIEFYEPGDTFYNHNYNKTGNGSELKVFSFVIECIKDSIIDYSPDVITFSAEKADDNRIRLYTISK